MREAAVSGTVNRGSHEDLCGVGVAVVQYEARRRAARNVEPAGIGYAALVGALGFIVVLIARRARVADVGGDGPVSGRPFVVPTAGEDPVLRGVEEVAGQGDQIGYRCTDQRVVPTGDEIRIIRGVRVVAQIGLDAAPVVRPASAAVIRSDLAL